MVLPLAGAVIVRGDGITVSTVMATLVVVTACPLGVSSVMARVAGPSARAGPMIQLQLPVGVATAEQVSPFGPVTTIVDPGVAQLPETSGVLSKMLDPSIGASTMRLEAGAQLGRQRVLTLKFDQAMRMIPFHGILA